MITAGFPKGQIQLIAGPASSGKSFYNYALRTVPGGNLFMHDCESVFSFVDGDLKSVWANYRKTRQFEAMKQK